MPSGAKKRKAARKKKEMAVPHLPDSPTDRPHGNGERESGSEEEGERGMEAHGVEGAENGAEEQHREENQEEVIDSEKAGDVSVEVVEVREKVEEKPEPEEEEEEAQAVVVPFVEVSSVNEEVVEAIEGLAEEADVVEEAVVLKEAVERTSVKESEEVMVLAVSEKISERSSESGERLAEKISEPPVESPQDTVVAVTEKISERPSESDERLPETKSREIPHTTEASSAPLVVRRATWWNCCGLLEVFSGSQS